MFNIIVAFIAILAIVAGIRGAWWLFMEIRHDDGDGTIYETDIVSPYPPELKEAVEVMSQPVYGPQTFEMANLTLRLSRPHLFADNWYTESRKTFSAWAAEQWYLIDKHEREMGIGAYAT